MAIGPSALSYLGKAASFAMRHPTATLTTAGAVGGFVGSGGSGWGAVAGAGLGYFGGGRKGWNIKKGTALQKTSDVLGKKYPKAAKLFSGRQGGSVGRGRVREPLAAVPQPKAGQTVSIPGVPQAQPKSPGAWSPRMASSKPAPKTFTYQPPSSLPLSAMVFGRGMRTAAVGLAGAGMGLAVGVGGKVVGSTFGGEKRSHHGAVFSGMGNGTLRGY